MEDDKITKIEQQINAISRQLEEMNKDVFSALYIERKYADFRNRLKVPNYGSTPSTCKTGELCEVGGKLYICSAVDTWSLVGSQV
jgi:hypothetical protein